MIKSVVFFKRKPGMPVDEFQTYWRTKHPEVVIKLPGIHAMCNRTPSIYAKREPVYDGIAEVWTDDFDAFSAMGRALQYPVVAADEAKFIDRANMRFVIMQEHVIKDGLTAAIKRVEFLTKRRNLSTDAFQKYWPDVHGPIAAMIPGLRRYVQSHPLPAAYLLRAPNYDGIAATWFDSTDVMRHAATTPEYVATRADEPNFLAAGDSPTIITTEHLIVD